MRNWFRTEKDWSQGVGGEKVGNVGVDRKTGVSGLGDVVEGLSQREEAKW